MSFNNIRDTVVDTFVNAKVPITVFLGTILVLYSFKPSFLFEDNGHRRQFGLGYNRDQEKRTLFDLTVTVVIFAFILGCTL